MKASAPAMAWIIINEKAGSGRALHAGRRLRESLTDAEVHATTGPGHASEVARMARQNGIDTVIAVGGDGTFSEVVSGLCLDERGTPIAPQTRLALLPAGTGGDYRRSHGMNHSLEAALRRIREPSPMKVDVGHASYTTHDGSIRHHAFVNVMSFGLGGLTDQLVSRGPKWLGGRAAFFLGAARATLVYQPPPVQLVLDDQPLPVSAFSNVALCIGRFFGGGMEIAPDARLDDGLFEVVTIEGSRLQTLALAGSIYRGRHTHRPGVHSYRASKIEARVNRSAQCLVDLDGEQLGRLPISARVIPRALTLLT